MTAKNSTRGKMVVLSVACFATAADAGKCCWQNPMLLIMVVRRGIATWKTQCGLRM